jgi:hypothetical protein
MHIIISIIGICERFQVDPSWLMSLAIFVSFGFGENVCKYLKNSHTRGCFTHEQYVLLFKFCMNIIKSIIGMCARFQVDPSWFMRLAIFVSFGFGENGCKC